MIDPSVRHVSRTYSKMDNLVRIYNDVFDIAARLKEIDGAYYPVYNLTKKRYEVHREGMKVSLQVVIPYNSLDKRTLDRVRETRIEYAEKMIREMDEENERKREREEKSQKSEAEQKAKELLRDLAKRS